MASTRSDGWGALSFRNIFLFAALWPGPNPCATFITKFIYRLMRETPNIDRQRKHNSSWMRTKCSNNVAPINPPPSPSSHYRSSFYNIHLRLLLAKVEPNSIWYRRAVKALCLRTDPRRVSHMDGECWQKEEKREMEGVGSFLTFLVTEIDLQCNFCQGNKIWTA